MIKLDGWITIGTRLDTDKFDKQISDLENKIDSEGKKQEFLNNQTKEYQTELQKANREVNALTREYDKAVKKAEVYGEALRKAEKVTPRSPKIFEFRSDYNEQVKKVDELALKLDKAEKVQSQLQNKVEKTKLQYDKSVKSADRLRGKIETINFNRHSKEVNTLTNNMGKAIRKVGKLALAVLSVRSAYSLLRQASSTWGQYNEQYARDIEYIRFALAYGLAPVLEKIVQLVQTLMTYINYLANAWFGKTIFASAKDFEKMSKSASGVAKSTKEIKNNLASFDELNVLSKSASDGAGQGFLAPSFDFGNFDVEIPEWIKWLGDNGETVKKTLIGIGGALGAMKLSELATNLGLVSSKLSLIKGIGVGVAVKGIAEGVQDLQKYIDEPTLENLGKTITDVGEAVVGVGIATGNLPIIAGGALTILTGKFVENWDEIRDTTQQGIDFLKEKSPVIERIFGKTGKIIYDDVLDNCSEVLSTVDTTLNSFSKMAYDFGGIIQALADKDWARAWQKFKDVCKDAWEGITAIIRVQINSIIRFINLLIDRTENFVNNFIDGLNNLGASINRVNFNRIPLLEKQNVVSMPTMNQLGIQGPTIGNTSFDTSGTGNSIAERVSNISQDITVKFEGTMAQFVRSLKPQIEIENKRVGTKIITGGAY